MKQQLFMYLTCLFILCGINKGNTQNLFNPTTYSNWQSTPANLFATTPAAPGVTFSQISFGSGNQFSTAPDGVICGKWNSASAAVAIADNRYFTFSVTSNSTTAAQIDSLSFILYKSSASAPDSCILQYKSSATGNVFVPMNATVYALPFAALIDVPVLMIPSSSILVPANETVVFRLVAWNATNTLAKLKIVNGTQVFGSATPANSNSISAATPASIDPICISSVQGDSIEVSFNSSGTFNAGNTYSLQLSDAAGSFASPLTIGTINSSSNNGAITGFIPAGTASANYQVRIASSNPVVNGLETTQITVHPGIMVDGTIAQPTCPNDRGAITLTVNGGSGALQYNWSNGDITQNITNVNAGTYHVIVTDGVTCFAEQEFVIQSVPDFSVTDIITPATCHSGTDGSIQVAITGGTAPYSISWDGNGINQTGLSATGLSAGTYTVTVLDENDCLYTNAYMVDEPDAITISAAIVHAACPGCDGSIALNVTGGVAPYSYTWSTGSNDQVLVDLPGEYCVEILDDNGCQSDSCFTIVSTLGIGDKTNGTTTLVFPNPATDLIQIVFPAGDHGLKKEVRIFNTMGGLIFEETINPETEQLNVNVQAWAQGVYTYQINTKRGTVESNRITVMH